MRSLTVTPLPLEGGLRSDGNFKSNFCNRVERVRIVLEKFEGFRYLVGDLLNPDGVIIFYCAVVVIHCTASTSPGHINVAGIIHCNWARFVNAVSRTVVSLNPGYWTWVIIFDSADIFPGSASYAGACYTDIPWIINRNWSCNISVISRTVEPLSPLLYTRRVVFYCAVIMTCSAARTAASYVYISRIVNWDWICITAISRTVISFCPFFYNLALGFLGKCKNKC